MFENAGVPPGHPRRSTVAAPDAACTRRAAAWCLLGAAAMGGLALAGCATGTAATGALQTTPPIDTLGALAPWLDGGAPPPDILILGERHDARDHQALQAELVRRLAASGRLAALVLEMAEQGRRTTGLDAEARRDEARVRAALAWDERAWPWAAYAPVVQAALAGGAEVLGGNLPRAALRTTMQDAAFDTRLDAAGLTRQRDAVRDGHCHLLPEAQIGPMTRVQIARDIAMADTAAQAFQAAQAGQGPSGARCVVIVCGAQHALRSIGIPRHLPPTRRVHVLVAQAARAAGAAALPVGRPGDVDTLLTTAPLPERDECAPLRQRRA